MDQDYEAGRAFDESAYRRTVSNAHDAVTLPMPDLHPVARLDGPIGDHRHVGDPTPSLQALDLRRRRPSRRRFTGRVNAIRGS